MAGGANATRVAPENNMRKAGAVGVGWMVAVTVDQVVGFMTSGLGKPAAAASPASDLPTSMTDVASAIEQIGGAGGAAASGVGSIEILLAIGIGLIAGFCGGWIAAMIDEEFSAARNLAILLCVAAVVGAGFASMAGYNDTAITWAIGGVMQAVGAIVGGRAKFSA